MYTLRWLSGFNFSGPSLLYESILIGYYWVEMYTISE